MKSLIQTLTQKVIRYYIPTLLISLLLFGAGIFFSSKLSIDSSLVNLLPDNYSSVKTLKKIQNDVGNFETLQILIQGASFEELKKYTHRLAELLQEDPSVKIVEYKKDRTFLQHSALLFLQREELQNISSRIRKRIDRETLKHNPFFVDFDEDEEDEVQKSNTEAEEDFSLADYRKKYQLTDQNSYFTNDDQSIIVINVYPKGQSVNVNFAKQFYSHISQLITDNPPTSKKVFVEFGGNFKNKIDEYNTLINDVKSSILIGLSAILLLLFLYFKKAIPVIIISVVLLYSLSLTFAVTYLAIGKLNVMTAFLFVILFGLGIDYGIHFMARFLEEYTGENIQEALLATNLSTGIAIKTTALTSAVAFAVFSFADFKGFSEFGIISCLGVIFAFLSYITLAPAIVIMTNKMKLLSPAKQKDSSKEKRLSLVSLFARHKYSLFVICIVLTLAGLYSSTQLNFLYDFTDLRANLPQSLKVKEKLGKIFKSSNSPAIVMANGKEELQELNNYLNAKISSQKDYTVEKFRSIYNILPDQQDEKLKIIKEIKQQLGRIKDKKLSAAEQKDVDELIDMTEVKKIDISALPQSIAKVFTDKNGKIDQFAYIFPSIQLRDSRKAMQFSKDIHKIQLGEKTFWAANSAIVFADLLNTVVNEGRYISLFAFIGVCLLVFLDVLSIKKLIVVMIPLVSAGLWIALVMHLFHMKLNFFNIVAIPMLIGIGVDNSIHIFQRLEEEFANHSVNLSLVFKTTGMAVIMSCLTTMVGFLGMTMAHHNGLKELGIMALLGIFSTMLTALTMLPASFLIFNRKKITELR